MMDYHNMFNTLGENQKTCLLTSFIITGLEEMQIQKHQVAK